MRRIPPLGFGARGANELAIMRPLIRGGSDTAKGRSCQRVRLALIRGEQSRRDEAKHMARLRAISEKIDKVQATLPQSIDPQLGNYLQRRSYDKALEFLEQL